MPTVCAVYGCTNKTTNKNVSFYRFPPKKKKLDLENKQVDAMRICSSHFKNGKPACYTNNKHPDWCPSINMGYNTNKGAATTPDINRYHRATKRMALTPTILFPNDLEDNTVVTVSNLSDVENMDISMETGTSTSTTMTMANIQTLEQEVVTKDFVINKLTSEVNYLNLSEETFNGRPKMLAFYTGLESMDLFLLILEEIKPALTSSNQRLTEFQKLLLCLMKLRLNMPFVDLGYRFNITCGTASIIFRKVIFLLEHAFKKLIYWPDREALRYLMPRSFFNAFGNSVAVIIDCFEIEIEKPSNFRAKAQTWSSYKNKNTVKYLIAITPQVVVSFISEGWGGRVSDKHITENCMFLKNLLPGDVVLADRGFTVSESIGFHFATLKTPAFTRGLPQLHPCSIEETRKIASVRIHVERIIGLTRSKYKILNGPVQITTLKHQDDNSCLLDSIVTVCCALINMCSSIVPLD
ncbi:unnamed protein product [Macrosiphum euphorbiae]|uniref:THAP-type domain-containing protein n=1 Tax=Macrosiphum euphorbiae TaxID=13131 RepID=A0AAV0Y5K3_9HEMI|nr:unnamed protein product [Macrosiphum euphorbiae]